MTHFFVVVLVRKKVGQDIEKSVSELLAPYDQQLEVAEHEESCVCIGREAHASARREAEKKFGTTWSAEAEEFEDKTFESDPAKSSPLPNCEYCSGRGKYKTTYNPNGQWDWWRVGGRYDGVIRDKPSNVGWHDIGPEHQKLEHNMSTPQFLIDHNIIPSAIVTPDGRWYEEDPRRSTEWEGTAKSIFAKNLGTHAVGLDCHA